MKNKRQKKEPPREMQQGRAVYLFLSTLAVMIKIKEAKQRSAGLNKLHSD